jgi:hypothetical protein
MATASTSICKPRRFRQPKQHREIASAEPGNNALEPEREACCTGVVVIVSVDEAIEPEGVTVDGEKVHDAHEGNPAQVREVSAANPFCGVTSTVVVPLVPATMASDAGETSTEKLGEAANWPMVKLAEATALVELPLATAMACNVSVEDIAMGPEYTAELVVGVEPFVV